MTGRMDRKRGVKTSFSLVVVVGGSGGGGTGGGTGC